MKNRIIKSISSLLLIVAVGCTNDYYLDKGPFTVIEEDAVFSDKNLTEANLLNLYDRTKFEELGGQSDFNMGLIAAMGGSARTVGAWQTPYAAALRVYDETGAGSMAYWPYNLIRDINSFIVGINNSELESEYILQRESEARFLRAWAYFQMVKRYGGVPIITVPQQQDDPEEELYPARNTEKEVYDFIIEEAQAIAERLPSVYDGNDYGRVSKWAAIALVSRAGLYAGSIAKFGEENGPVGIPAGQANTYFQKSLDASKEIITKGPFSLYNRESDLSKNFERLFVDENDNPEVILALRFDFEAQVGHSWDNLATPVGFTSAWSSNYPVYLNVLDLFDYADGSSGAFDRTKFDGETLISKEELFENRDPRFAASIFYPEIEWQGSNAYFHSSTIYTDENGERQESNSETFTIPGSDWRAKAPNKNQHRTGLLIKKRVDESYEPVASGQSSSDFLVFRYGEILLNYAEAGFYLGTGDALDKLNQVRDRVGMPKRNELTEENIRQERQVELLFEEHRYWDLKRWRIADQVLNGRLKGMRYVYDFDAQKYLITEVNGDSGVRVFDPTKHYYFALGVGRLADNPNLVENPGY
ncbi:RagB/SusD family nutrient uptake outer membrane protein [Joostella atrarenae]|uniref:RagB/SusD family nutrient uptake outer membrane protein n=1 Tax=Joostella atrarenae TaxID=679257 RepID=A0ABS9J5C8_9FLAO|nr:RagB/SusD family nutrient uptake outer membrane protein [Joostella atrarenae]MCF8715626.1 RagB/SusD family nutrient uptake outer membrane protein [Joostella atrarenae]